ncbi:epoxide hydrolase [Devosia epidermidihirudinis]|uniref:Epoxide hydrolase n=1 Tax=Devosia epidermidihirudinis TaxID=1293439 RepID=A0A0F5QAK8_9HYPH|nr:epoxide hydrolase family protein [Devosia epidermidihirudinis]KKC37751.1 epoxide hydrolase [Devosia epidermidihirudinis]
MHPFTIAIPDAALFDLEARLGQTRFAKTLPHTGWDYGIEDGFLREFITYWAEQYDWRGAEARLNAFPQFVEEIDGEAVHFVHVRGQGDTNVPILLTNGWPSNFVELLPLVPLLTAPVDGVAFDVVIPSLPGFGFSGQPNKPGMNLSAVAPLWAELMTRLGYDKFLISGSDMGTGVEMALVRDVPERLIGAHYVNVFSGFPRPSDPTPEEAAFLQRADYMAFTEGAYVTIQGTKPATLAVGLNDSPAGLAAWILEKYYVFSDNGGDIANAFALDDLATILSVYWFSQTIGSSVRLYKEAFADPQLMGPAPRHQVPHAVLLPPFDNPAPRAWGERNLQNIVRWSEARAGGHFPALEIPEEMAHDIRAFYGQIA